MSELLAETEHQLPLIGTIAQIAGIWLISDFGYYALLPVLGVYGYSQHPVLMGAYYALWAGIAYVLYYHLFRGWEAALRRPSLYVTLFVAIALSIVYLSFIFPLLPSISWSPAKPAPPELLIASQWYFLPKSFEILLQQLLVLALIRTFTTHGFSLRTTALWVALLFGSIHLTLIFGGVMMKVVVFTAAATVAGFIFPYLIERVRNGFVYSYGLHWSFYAVVIGVLRLLFS